MASNLISVVNESTPARLASSARSEKLRQVSSAKSALGGYFIYSRDMISGRKVFTAMATVIRPGNR